MGLGINDKKMLEELIGNKNLDFDKMKKAEEFLLSNKGLMYLKFKNISIKNLIKKEDPLKTDSGTKALIGTIICEWEGRRDKLLKKEK